MTVIKLSVLDKQELIRLKVWDYLQNRKIPKHMRTTRKKW